MSHIGKLTRGMKYYNQRDSNGVLPKGIAEDEAKMADVLYYEGFIKFRDEEKVNSLLTYHRQLRRNGKKDTPRCKEVVEAIDSKDLESKSKTDKELSNKKAENSKGGK